MHIVNQNGTATKPGEHCRKDMFVRGIAARSKTANLYAIMRIDRRKGVPLH